MILYTNEKDIKIDLITDEISTINSILKNEIALKELLISYMDKISITINKMTNPTDTNEIHSYLSNLKINLDNVTKLISSFDDLLQFLNKIQEPINIQLLKEYNVSYKNIYSKYLQCNNDIYVFLDTLTQYISITFPEKIIQHEHLNTSNDNVLSNLKEHTLIISEKCQIVVLPYTISELKEKQKNDNIDNLSLQEVIEKHYTKPLSVYKNAPFARFKESLNLIREREKGSLKKALDLGLELFFNSNLHPAIISACRNLDELDIYLDYLNDGETDKFDCFNVIFEFAPILSKKEKKFRF